MHIQCSDTVYWEIFNINQFRCFCGFPSNLENLTSRIFLSDSFIANYYAITRMQQ